MRPSKPTRSGIAVIAGLVLFLGCSLVLLRQPEANAPPPYEAWAPFTLPEEGMQAQVMLNNNRGHPVPFDLEVYDADGTLLDSNAFVAEPNASLDLPFGVDLPIARSGSVVIRYPRDVGAELPAQLLVHSPGLSVNYPLSERRFHSTSEAAATFWLPTPQSEVHLLLLNKSAEPLEVSLEIHTDRSNEILDTVLLGPGALRTFGVRQRYKLRQGRLAGAIRAVHSGEPGDLIPQGFVFDAGRGFSASLNWMDAGFAALSNTVILKHLKYGNHVEGFFVPHLTLFNKSQSDVQVHPLLRLDGREPLALEALPLGPGEVQSVNLEPELRRRFLSAPLETAMELTYSGDTGSVVASGVCVDRTLQHAHTSKVAAEAELKQSYSYPFRNDAGWNTKVVVSNRSPDPAGYSVFFFYEGQHYTYPTHHFLQPFEQRVIDVSQVRREQLPDDFGRTLPAEGPLSGQIKLLVHEGYLGKIIAQGVVENVDLGMAIPLSCDTCPAQPNLLVLLDSISGFPGQQARFNSFAGGPKQQIFPKLELSDGSSWFETGGVVRYFPTDDDVTQVDVGFSADFVEFLAPGQAEIEAELDSCFWRTNFNTCEPQPGGGQSCECECLPIVLTVPPSQGFLQSPPALVTVSEPTVILQDLVGVPKNAEKNVQVVILEGPLNVDVELRLSTTTGSGSARFAANNSTTLNVRQSGSIRIKGVTESSTADNIELKAVLGGQTLASAEFSVVWVTLSLRTSGSVSPDNSARGFYEDLFDTAGLGAIPLETTTGNTFWHLTGEIVGTVKPSNFSGPIRLERRLDLSKVYQNTTLINTVGPIPDDTSADVLRDDDPQSGGSTGRVYDLDAPAFSVPGSEVGSIRRRRDNFTQWAAFDGMRASSDFHWFFRMSLIETTSGEILHNDVSSDNRLGVGITKQTWNLQ